MKEKKYSYGIYNLPPIPTSPPISGWHQFQSHPNAPGRDPIVTRILRLRGLDQQNSRALSRGIFIHGTPDERNIGRPASYGCIRMKSRDVVELFDHVRTGTRVEITTDRVGGLFGSLPRVAAGRG
jgi:lipoprotein-anchoring transpeptidase ErfK/SrfK